MQYTRQIIKNRDKQDMGFKKLTAGLLLASFTALSGVPAHAQNVSPQTAPATGTRSIEYANALHLAYVVSQSQSINAESRNGLSGLAEEIGKKTSVVPKGVIGIDIEKDEIAVFPFIYWPVSANAPRLSENAQKKVQNYINAGGMIVFDTGYAGGNAQSALSNMLGNVIIKPLVQMDRKHTLTKSFYLVADLTGGRNGTIWVEAPGAKGAENVSSVIIGDKMWARAWVGMAAQTNEDERNLVLRSGINMVMYALTGNYKEDQIHIPSILERLDR
jgi:hypothetical protein